MFVKVEKTCRWKIGTAGVQKQFIKGKTYEVSDSVGKAMIDAGYASKGKGAKVEKEEKVIKPDSKEDGAPKDETKVEEKTDDSTADESEKTDDQPKAETKEEEKAKSSIFSRKK